MPTAVLEGLPRLSGGAPPRNDARQGTLRSSALTSVGGRGGVGDGQRSVERATTRAPRPLRKAAGGAPPRNDARQGTLRSSALTSVGGRGGVGDGQRSVERATTRPPRPLRRAAG